jgi:hypothetical protein
MFYLTTKWHMAWEKPSSALNTWPNAPFPGLESKTGLCSEKPATTSLRYDTNRCYGPASISGAEASNWRATLSSNDRVRTSRKTPIQTPGIYSGNREIMPHKWYDDMIWHINILKLGHHPVAVVGRLAKKNRKETAIYKRRNIQNTKIMMIIIMNIIIFNKNN